MIRVFQVLPKGFSDRGGTHGIEVANKNHLVTFVGTLGDDPQNVVDRGMGPAVTTGIVRQRTVVVDEENSVATSFVLQPVPDDTAHATPLRLRVVLCHILVAALEMRPDI